MKRDEALELMREILEGLRRSGLAEAGDPLGAETVLIGAGAALDSVGFVTFIAELEDRLSAGRREPVELILTDVWQFNRDDPFLSAGVLADYCAQEVAGRS
ncbi:MAG: hypothetical protein FJ028_00705 [Chloroflexi bacterium]|nr:hypothetical protein [Chloroflexota bacterium]